MIAHRTETKDNAPSRAQRLAQLGDVFYQTVRPYQKNNYLFDLPYDNYVFSTGYAQMRPNIDSYFLLSRLQEEGFVKLVLDRCTGTSYPAINSNDLADIEIKVPVNRDEQTKIGNLFRSLDTIITLHQRKYDKTISIKNVMLEKLFPKDSENLPEINFLRFAITWEQRTISETAEKFDNLRIPITASDRIAGNTPYYGANGIQDYVEGFTHDGEFVLVAEDGANDLQDYPVKYVNGKVWVNNHAHVLQGKVGLTDTKFLMSAIKNIDIEPFLVGGGRAKLNADVMMKLKLSMPSLQEQIKLGTFFEQVDTLITLHQREC